LFDLRGASGYSTLGDGALVFMAASAWALRYEQEKWPEIAFVDVKDYQRKAA
jgi:peptide chain release factor 3